ncbi:SLC13 family permease [Parvularcula marina]|uniref:SLC13/DASS family transporter n=1 Tax=Parvularcula marina TaxID=2292771 RepID=A0A371RG85_9PROT|nr:SLC13 family permease [Parvularcula marina]RFB04477.1 SLC13/DASS family transporter [Parvularcula marina]
MSETQIDVRTLRQRIGIVLGPVLALAILIIGPPDSLAAIDGVGSAWAAWTVLSLLSLMAVWWVTEAIPIPVTSLLPMVVLPVAGVLSIRDAAVQYMHPVVVLLMGGFIVAKAIEKWRLHERIALNIVLRAGDHPNRLVAGFMLAAAVLSMWISNTATSIMMMPIALSVAREMLGEGRENAPLTWALLLGIAWSCSIGGLGTPIGTPTNLIVISYLNQNAGFSIGFLQWMMVGIPVVLLMVPAAWFVLTRWAFRLRSGGGAAAREVIEEHLAALGKMTTPEKRVLGMFAVIAGLWIFRRPLSELTIGSVSLSGLSDAGIAIFGVILAFLIPAGGEGNKGRALLDWPTAERIPWGVILLFGGGLSLASAISATGLGLWIGSAMSGLASLHILLVMAILTAFVIFATEVTSNVATASALMPVIGAIALTTGLEIELLAAPLAMAASCAFMLPLATGPNAVAYATGQLTIPTMAAAGFRLNLLGIVLITLAVYFIAPTVLGSGS